jgi:acetylornithine deacetylase/succinyl-diaminopimelate desuccinylase-like protein
MNITTNSLQQQSSPRPVEDARVVEIARELIRFDTSNPPGHERPCIEYLENLIRGAGLQPELLAKDPQRPSLVVRLEGEQRQPGFLMYGHVDVVPAGEQAWQRPPFAAQVDDGVLWGRGSLDMKGGLAMMLEALLRMCESGTRPARDIVFAAFSDEEAGSEFGAMHVIGSRPDLFDGVRYAIGEFGGFSLTISGRRFYPIAVCEKQWCTLRLTLRGSAGHGAVPVRDGAMAKLGRVLTRLSKQRLPVHITPVARELLRSMGAALPARERIALRGLLCPRLTDRLLNLGGEDLAAFDPMLHNTVSATRVHGAQRIDAIPGTVTVDLDGRVLPGRGAQELLREVQQVCGKDAEVALTEVYETAPAEPDLGLFEILAAALEEIDSNALAVPMILPGVTDARFLAALGIQSYGFLPMRLPDGFELAQLIHAPDERIPISALEFGADVVERVLRGLGDVAP